MQSARQLEADPAELPDRSALESAAAIVYRELPPTPQYLWPQLAQRSGAELWLKHENAAFSGAFKVRGGLVYMHELKRRSPECRSVISATRGNHGQSIGHAARRHGVNAIIFVPHGNSREKNEAMRSLGVTLVEHGDDFQAARDQAYRVAEAEGLHVVPSFHRDLVRGVASYWLEFFQATPALDTVFLPIGQGSGFAACVAAREALGLRTRVIGVVSAHAPCYTRSLRSGTPTSAPVTTQLADGLACREPFPESLELVRRYAEDVVEVTDDEVAEAMRLLFSTTHQVAEGAGAAALAAFMARKAHFAGKRVGLPITGGNVDSDLFARVLQGASQ